MKEELKLPVMLKPQRYAFKGGGGGGGGGGGQVRSRKL